MIQQSYIWEQFSEYIHCKPFCKNCVSILYRLFLKDRVHTVYRHLYNSLIFFKKIIAKVQMFKFWLTCFKARKAKTIAFFLKYWELYFV